VEGEEGAEVVAVELEYLLEMEWVPGVLPVEK